SPLRGLAQPHSLVGSEREKVYNAPHETRSTWHMGSVDAASEGQTMFDKIQHIGYLVADLDKAVEWFKQGFGAGNAGGGPVQSSRAVPGGGGNAFVHFGQVEAELIEPGDTSNLPHDTLVLHHVGYVVADIPGAVERAQARGFRFIAATPFT